jgi:hypothetical protein
VHRELSDIFIIVELLVYAQISFHMLLLLLSFSTVLTLTPTVLTSLQARFYRARKGWLVLGLKQLNLKSQNSYVVVMFILFIVEMSLHARTTLTSSLF